MHQQDILIFFEYQRQIFGICPCKRNPRKGNPEAANKDLSSGSNLTLGARV